MQDSTTASVKTYPGADICSCHNPVVMRFKIKFKKLERIIDTEMNKKVKVITDDKPRSRGSKCIKDKDRHVLFDEKEKHQKEMGREYHQTL